MIEDWERETTLTTGATSPSVQVLMAVTALPERIALGFRVDAALVLVGALIALATSVAPSP